MNLLKYEKQLIKEGYKVICGVDECGMGSIAGAVVACAIVIDIKLAKHIVTKTTKFWKINDSKKLPKYVREILYKKILAKAFAIGIGVVSVEEIEQIRNIRKCGYLARYKAVQLLARSNGWKHLQWHVKDQNFEYAIKHKILYTKVGQSGADSIYGSNVLTFIAQKLNLETISDIRSSIETALSYLKYIQSQNNNAKEKIYIIRNFLVMQNKTNPMDVQVYFEIVNEANTSNAISVGG